MRSRVTQHFIRTRCNSNLLSQYYRIEFAFSFMCINRHDGESSILFVQNPIFLCRSQLRAFLKRLMLLNVFFFFIINWVG